MDEQRDLTVAREPDQLELYNHIYELSKRDYKTLLLKSIAKRSFSLVVLLLSAAGLFFTIFYFIFLKDRIGDLREQLSLSFGKIEQLRAEVERLTISELKYRNQLRLYEDTFRNLKFEDGRVIDYDLTETVRNNLAALDASLGEYRNITRGNTRFNETALTLDLGTGEDLPYVCSVLKRYGAKATVFVSNEMPSEEYGSLFRERNVEYLVKLAGLGCEFGNHTWSHFNLKESLYETSKRRRLALAYVSDGVLDEVTLKLEFDRVSETFRRRTGLGLSPYWRAPYGAFDRRILSAAAKAGYPNHVLWSANARGPLDFYDYIHKNVSRGVKGNPRFLRSLNRRYFSSSETLVRLKLWEAADPNGLRGAISIGHLGTSRKTDKIIYSLPEYISFFQRKGYHFVTLTELLNDKADY
jgi:peptidoglycan/xylan/chitin deacetylase (PgdA/CDA1 family)